MSSVSSHCIWSGHQRKVVEGKKFCHDCQHTCKHECITCHRPYPNEKNNFTLDTKRCDSCTTHYKNAKLYRKKTSKNIHRNCNSRTLIQLMMKMTMMRKKLKRKRGGKLNPCQMMKRMLTCKMMQRKWPVLMSSLFQTMTAYRKTWKRKRERITRHC